MLGTGTGLRGFGSGADRGRVYAGFPGFSGGSGAGPGPGRVPRGSGRDFMRDFGVPGPYPEPAYAPPEPGSFGKGYGTKGITNRSKCRVIAFRY